MGSEEEAPPEEAPPGVIANMLTARDAVMGPSLGMTLEDPSLTDDIRLMDMFRMEDMLPFRARLMLRFILYLNRLDICAILTTRSALRFMYRRYRR